MTTSPISVMATTVVVVGLIAVSMNLIQPASAAECGSGDWCPNCVDVNNCTMYNCSWDSIRKSCKTMPAQTPAPPAGGVNCSMYNGQMQQCQQMTQCMWSEPMCMANSSSGSGNGSTPAPMSGVNCSMYSDQSMCMSYAAYCHWESGTTAGGWCKNGAAATPAPMSGVNCSMYTSDVTCAREEMYCMWSQGMCWAKTTPAPMTGVNCSMYSDQSMCMYYQAYCHWMAGAAGSAGGWCKNGHASNGSTPAPMTPPTSCDTVMTEAVCNNYASSWNCEWKNMKCATRPPMQNTTMAPVFNCESVMKSADCDSESACYWFSTTSVTATGGSTTTGKCVVKPCLMFAAAMCPTNTGRCTMDAGRCLPPPCWNNTQYTCGLRGGACMWKSSSSTTQSSMGDCVPVGCDDISSNKGACQASPRCWWSENNATCVDLPCTNANCYQSICKMASMMTASGSSMEWCRAKMCSEYDFDGCPRNWCSISTNTGKCENAACSALSPYRTACALRPDCMSTWKTATGSTSAMHTCDVKPCNLHTDMTKCTQSNCIVDQATATCHFPACYMAKDNMPWCKSIPNCWWNADATEDWRRCSPTPCDQITSVTACTKPCSWNRETSKCWSMKCVEFTTAAECPVSSGQCGWSSTMNLCINSVCGRYDDQSNCTTKGGSGCMWSGSMGCMDANTPTAIACSTAPSQAMCASFPMPTNRCSWTAAGNAGYCAPTPPTGTDAKKCYEFAMNSECPSYCTNMYGYCIDPTCEELNKIDLSQMNATTKQWNCNMWKCRWNSDGKCFDSRTNMFACGVYSNSTYPCPAGRCQWTASNMMCSTPGDSTTGDDNEAPIVCKDINDVASCSTATHCMFDQTTNMCAIRPCDQYSQVDNCPTDRCKWNNGACAAPCPTTRPVFCANLGTCVTSIAQCVGCPSSQTTCWNGECKNNFNDCACPADSPTRCVNTTMACVANADKCSMACPTGTVRCWNNDCAASFDYCPCPTTQPTKCNVSGKVWCGVNRDSCEFKCPTTSPFTCWDGACAMNEASCACPSTKPYRCATNRVCLSDKTQCPCSTSTSTRCADMSCAPAGSVCGSVPATPMPTMANCSTAMPFQCPDGSCAAQRFGCVSCATAAEATPEIEILTNSETFDVSQLTRLMVKVTYMVCGVDVGFKLTPTWTVYQAVTGVEARTSSTGSLLVVPENTLMAGQLYTFKATVTIPDSTFAVSASVKLEGFAPAPEFWIMGGDRSMPAGQSLSLTTQLTDHSTTTAANSAVTWVCSTNMGRSDCPAVFGSMTMTRTQTVESVPVGVYMITAYYKNVNSTVTITATEVVEDKMPAPQVSLKMITSTGLVFAGSDVQLYAIVDTSNTTMSWYVDGSKKAMYTTQGVTFPSSWFTAGATYTLKAVATTTDGTYGFSSIRITILPKPMVSCNIEAMSGAMSNGDFAALKTHARLSAPTVSFSTSTTASASAPKVQYMFGYMAKDTDDTEVEFKLSTFWQDLNYVDFTAPILAGNMKKSVMFVAAARLVGGTTVVRQMCTAVNIDAATYADVKESAAANVVALDRAVTDNDPTTAVKAATAVSNTLDVSTDDATRRMNSVKVVEGLEKAAETGKTTLSTTERGDVVRAMQRVFASNEKDTNMTAAKEFLIQNAAKILKTIQALLEQKGESALDVSTEGTATLEVLSKSRVQGDTTQNIAVADEVNKLGRKFARAAATTLGVAQVMRRANITVSGVAKSAIELGETMFGGGNSSCKFPMGFKLMNRNSTNTVQLSSVAYDQNPVGEAGKPTGSSIVSSVSDFHVQVDDQDETVKDVSPPLELTFTLTAEEAAQKDANSKFYCRYFDQTTKQWSMTGVSFVKYEMSTHKVHCSCTHLSTFGAFADNEASTSGTSSTTNSPAPAGVTTTTTAAPGIATTTTTTMAPSGSNGGTGATTTLSPATAMPLATPNPTNAGNNGGAAATGGDDDDATMGAIIGGSIGGVLLIALLALVVIKVMGKKDNQDSDDERHDVPMLNTVPMNNQV